MGDHMEGETRNTGAAWIATGAVLGAIAVAAGAFGSHGLKAMVTPERLQVFETAVRYQMLHALALLAIGILSIGSSGRLLNLSASALTLGVVFFSGSLYLLVLTDTPWLGAITPIGGVSFIAGWLILASWALSRRRLPRREE